MVLSFSKLKSKFELYHEVINAKLLKCIQIETLSLKFTKPYPNETQFVTGLQY